MDKKSKRDKQIRADIKQLIDSGFKVKEATAVIADRYFMSKARIHDIYYFKYVDYCTKEEDKNQLFFEF